MRHLNVGGTTYDTVGEASVTQVLGSGTKIATVSIDGTSTDLYAPEGGSSVDPATAAPSMDGTAAVGSSAKYAREDHVHPTDTSRQAALVSGTNIKTVNGNSLLGSGDIAISGGISAIYLNTPSEPYNVPVSSGTATIDIGDGLKVSDSGNTATLKANIKTINSTSLLGSGDVAVQPTLVSGTNIKTVNSTSLLGSGDIAVQPTLVSGTNIKTVNGNSLLGSGDVSVSSPPTTWYGTCSTAASEYVKVVTCENFVLTTGAILVVKFTNANTYSGSYVMSMNVNSTGNKYISYGTSYVTGDSNNIPWAANTYMVFSYDGSSWVYLSSSSGKTTTTIYGGGIFYGGSNSNPDDQNKVSSGVQFSLRTNSVVIVEFYQENTYTSGPLTLNVASTGAKTIYHRRAGTSSSNTLLWNANDTLVFLYDNNRYIYLGGSTAYDLPSVSASDNGKVLRVVNGAWAAASLPSASGVSF